MLELPEGGVVSVEAEDTDVLDDEPVVSVQSGAVTLSCEGARALLGLLEGCMARIAVDGARGAGGDSHDA